ncbi:MAG: 16S rRNA processing protein RimM [Chloroflexi bacterium]|nr:16S rRNA processing protein RimM [Chloroflexota bacterium]
MPAPDKLIIGRVVGAFGLLGDMKVAIETDFPERFKSLAAVFIGNERFEVERGRLHPPHALVKVKGVETPEHAATFKGGEMSVDVSDAVPLKPGQHYVYEIEGLAVETTAGEALGRVIEVWKTGANAVYLVRDEAGTEILLPAIPQVVRSVDVAAGKMIVELLEGLR